MSRLTHLPPLDQLPNPHLLVLGAWKDQLARVLAHRVHRDHALVALLPRDARDFPGCGTVDAQALDLIGCLAGGADSIANLRAMLLPLADGCRSDLAAFFDQLMATAALTRAMPAPSSRRAVATRFPDGMSSTGIATVLDDMIHQALSAGRPAPVAVIAGDGRGRRRCTLREARVELECGRLRLDELVVMLPADGPADWLPYAVQGLVPEVPDAVVDVEIAGERDRLRAEPAFARAPDDALEALARSHIAARRWQLTWRRALPADGAAPSLSSALVLQAMRECEPLRAFADRIGVLLAGTAAAPDWWNGGVRLVGASPRQHALRRAVVLETLLEAAAAPRTARVAKVLMVDAEVLGGDPVVAAALERLLRAGRKHDLCVVVLALSLPPSLSRLGELAANWLVDVDAAAGVPHLHAAVRAHGDAQGWWLTSASPRPQALGTWFTSEEVALGDRLLSGARDAIEAV